MHPTPWLKLLIAFSVFYGATEKAQSQSPDSSRRQGIDHPRGIAETRPSQGTPSAVLSAKEWHQVNASVARALDWLAGQQQPDGSFPSLANGQPAVTSLCMMAF